MEVHRILVPVDFSEQARAALVEADQRALDRNATLHLLHVHQIVEVALLDFTYVEPAEKISAMCEAAETRLREWAGDLRTPANRVTFEVRTGMPIAEIIEASKAFDLIVMSTHGRTGVSHFLLGSVAERVVQGAQCSVLIYKDRGALPRSSKESTSQSSNGPATQ